MIFVYFMCFYHFFVSAFSDLVEHFIQFYFIFSFSVSIILLFSDWPRNYNIHFHFPQSSVPSQHSLFQYFVWDGRKDKNTLQYVFFFPSYRGNIDSPSCFWRLQVGLGVTTSLTHLHQNYSLFLLQLFYEGFKWKSL